MECPTETVSSNKITGNGEVLSVKGSPRKPLEQRTNVSQISVHVRRKRPVTGNVTARAEPSFVWSRRADLKFRGGGKGHILHSTYMYSSCSPSLPPSVRVRNFFSSDERASAAYLHRHARRLYEALKLARSAERERERGRVWISSWNAANAQSALAYFRQKMP